MANILTFTEAFDNSVWTLSFGTSDLLVTADTHAAPAFAGGSAGLADTVEDISGTVQAAINQTKAKGSNDTESWVVSIFVRKTTGTPSYFPEFRVEFRDGGTSKARGIRFNPTTGDIAASPAVTAPLESGQEDIDADWWRVWIRELDNASGNSNIRLVFFPAIATSMTVGANGAVTGSQVVWGGNVTKSSTLLQYEPDPFYEFPGGEDWTTLATLGSAANSYSDQDVLLVGGTEYDYRILAENTAGQTPSNVVVAAPNAESGGAGNLIVQARRLWSGMYRAIGRGVN